MKKLIILLGVLFYVQLATAQVCKTNIGPNTSNLRFSVNGNEVTDKETGLTWRRCSLGQSGDNCSTGSPSTYTWNGALQAAKDQRIETGQLWRLPNIKELSSIVEEECFSPSINLTIFPGTESASYWSASLNDDNAKNAWNVIFYFGHLRDYAINGESYVRLVRGG